MAIIPRGTRLTDIKILIETTISKSPNQTIISNTLIAVGNPLRQTTTHSLNRIVVIEKTIFKNKTVETLGRINTTKIVNLEKIIFRNKTGITFKRTKGLRITPKTLT